MRPVGSPQIAALCLAVLSTGCILYSDPINRAPEISGIAVNPPSRPTHARRSPVNFEAMVSDDQTQPLSMTWWVAPGACRDPWPADGKALSANRFVPSVLGPHCVRVDVADEHGASATSTLQFEVTNAPPGAQIAMTAPPRSTGSYPLFSEFVLEPGLSDPDSEETPQHRWALTGPDGKGRVITPCGTREKSLCFTGETAGTYRITLDATDSDGGQATQAALVLQLDEDAPPCIIEPQPALLDVVRDPNRSLTLSFAVADDGDPLPARASHPSLTTITWRFRRAGSGSFDRLVGASERFLTLPAGAFAPGDDVELRVDIADRVERMPSEACTDEATTCSRTANCQQRMTWRLRYL